jgi:hypothetical protein
MQQNKLGWLAKLIKIAEDCTKGWPLMKNITVSLFGKELPKVPLDTFSGTNSLFNGVSLTNKGSTSLGQKETRKV